MSDPIFPDLITTVIDGNDKRKRVGDWIGIIIHHTGTSPSSEDDETGWAKLFKAVSNYLAAKDEAYVSAHFNIGRRGEICQIIDPRNWVSFHAGSSYFWHPEKRKFVDNWNNHSIGIEITGDGNKLLYSRAQYESTARLAASLMKKFPTISPLCIVGHEMIAPGRKIDPGKFFDWQLFYRLLYEEVRKLEQ